MKIGIISTNIQAKTGYGRICRELEKRIDEHEWVHIDAEMPMIVYGAKDYFEIDGKKILVVGCPNPQINISDASSILRVFFEKYELDTFLFHWDVWAGTEVLKRTEKPYILYIPIDSYLTRKWANYVGNAQKLILYSWFAYNESLKFFHPSQLAMIYHGVDCKVFKPQKNIENLRSEINANPPIPEDCFLFTFTGANMGQRKCIPQLIRVFKKVSSECPEAHLYLHTTPNQRGGFDLPMLIDSLDLKEKVHLSSTNVLFPVTDEEFCRIYNASDCYVSLSQIEGFGLPLIEAAACGTPLIAHGGGAQREIVEKCGWMIDSINEEMWIEYPSYVPTLQYNPCPNLKDAYEKMVYAASNPGEYKRKSKEARKFALKLDWEQNIIPQWSEMLNEVEEDLIMTKNLLA